MELCYCDCQAAHLTNCIVNGWAAKHAETVHERFEVIKCQPAFIVIGIQLNIRAVNTAQVFQIRACFPKISQPKDTWFRSSAVILKREYNVHVPEGKIIISGRNENRKRETENLRFSWVILPNLGHKTGIGHGLYLKTFGTLICLGVFINPGRHFKSLEHFCKSDCKLSLKTRLKTPSKLVFYKL